MSTNVFEFVKDLSFKKLGIFSEDNENDYQPFVINRAFSLYLDSVILASEMNNNSSLAKELQYDYYFYKLRKRNRWSKWPKRSEQEILELHSISEYFNVNNIKAKEYRDMLSKSEIEEIINYIKKKEEETA